LGSRAKPKSPSGKLATILAAIGGEKGATVDELVALTGWQKHTARAALTRLRQRGYPLQLIQQENRKA
jgi:DNA-binding IclR family transcriptional regulator